MKSIAGSFDKENIFVGIQNVADDSCGGETSSLYTKRM